MRRYALAPAHSPAGPRRASGRSPAAVSPRLRAPRALVGPVLCWVAALVGLAAPAHAHDWTSPPASMQPGAASQSEPAWSGLIWAGPRSGPPATPSATDCRRAPRRMEIQGPQSAQSPEAATGRADAARSRVAAGSAAPAMATAPRDAASLGAAKRGAAEPAVAEAMAPAAPAAPEVLADGLPPSPRAVQEPVTAGVIDDNADFGEYLAFQRRHASVAARQRDASERYRLSVHDAQGRPVPDAQVSLHAGGRALPLWARTDAGGQVWLHPGVAGVDERVVEVQVRKATAQGELLGTALLRRGQRDALQVRLDRDLPSEPARLDLVFLVDATGSMADEIDKLRRSMQAMADQIAALPSRPQTCFGLVAYRDRGDAFFVRAFDFSDDLGRFQQVLGELRAGGGGDYPEALNEALHTAVHGLSWRGDGATRMVVTVADAPPHLDRGAPWFDEDMQGALARGIKLFAVGASGLDRRGELAMRQMAQHTGGRFVFLTYAQAHNPGSGPGRETAHDVGGYSVETLDKLIVRLVREELARRPG